jgi:hypothetical protein
VPPYVLQDILDYPPKVAIGAVERIPPIGVAFPELRHMVTDKYVQTRHFRHILIYELKPEFWRGNPPPRPGPKR